MTIIGPIFTTIFFVGLVTFYWWRVYGEEKAYGRRWYLTWAAKGLAFPMVIWFLLNVGHTPVMPPLVKVMPQKVITPPPTVIPPDEDDPPGTPPTIIPGKPKKVGYGPVAFVLIQTIPALAPVSSFWGALTLGWFVRAMVRRVHDRKVFIICACLWCAAMLPFLAWILWSLKLAGLGLALTLWFGPIVHYLMALEPFRNPLPHYTSAIVKMKFGKYAEAEAAIIKELEKCENDFDGWLMLAELYARQFKDIGEAEKTILDLCDDANTTLSQKSVALHKLADWQLQFREDPVAARRSLEEIVNRMPGTHLAKMAAIRLGQIPATKQEWVEQQDHGRQIKMPALNDDLDHPAKENIRETNPAEAERAANQCVEKLERDPKDTAAREKLARIFAERLGQAALGVEQLELLLEMPEQPPNKMAAWLALAAAWRLKYLDDKEGAEKLLRRLIKDFPQSAQAFAAQRRLKLMEMEAR
jgi:hypothetical protein